jgi:molybdate transport system substrate-binding protein
MKPTVLFLMLMLAWPLSASTQEIRVLSGGAAKAFVDPVVAAMPPGSIKLEYQPMGRLVQSLAGGGTDMVIVTSEVYAQLQREGKLRAGSGTPVARVGIGVAVQEGSVVPDISTPDAFRRALLAAKSVVYIDPKVGTSGKHVAEVLDRLGIAEEVNRKATLGSGGYVVEPVGRGQVELGIHQISEIIPVKGVRLVGPLPAELQKYTVYVAVPVPGTEKTAAVSRFVERLTAPEARAKLAAAGYSPPE